MDLGPMDRNHNANIGVNDDEHGDAEGGHKETEYVNDVWWAPVKIVEGTARQVAFGHVSRTKIEDWWRGKDGRINPDDENDETGAPVGQSHARIEWVGNGVVALIGHCRNGHDGWGARQTAQEPIDLTAWDKDGREEGERAVSQGMNESNWTEGINCTVKTDTETLGIW